MSGRIDDMATALVDARTELKQIPPLRESHGLDTVEDAYAVQDAANKIWLGQGRRLVGRKIGLTSPAVQAQMGIDQPDYGMLWADYFFTEGEVVDTCVQLHGGAGFMEEYEIARMYCSARVSRIYAGTSEIMKEIIGRSLGLGERA